MSDTPSPDRTLESRPSESTSTEMRNFGLNGSVRVCGSANGPLPESSKPSSTTSAVGASVPLAMATVPSTAAPPPKKK